MSETKILVCISDPHCGSVVGLAPPETKTEAGNVIGFGENIHQAWLWEKWLLCISKVKKIVGRDKAALAINGDATEGVHHGNIAEILAVERIHAQIAYQCFLPYTKICKLIYVVKGTECHTKEMENELAKELGAVSGKARDEWLLRIHGCLVDIKHHMTTTGRAYLEASAMSILMGNARVNCVRSKHEVPQVFLRAHRHCGGHYTDDAGLFGVTGAWQFLTRHGKKVVGESIPRPSVLVLDWRDREFGELPRVHCIKFDPPQNEITEL